MVADCLSKICQDPPVGTLLLRVFWNLSFEHLKCMVQTVHYLTKPQSNMQIAGGHKKI